MADFNKAYPRVIGNEGGYALVAGDKGGETYIGISRKYWPNWKGWPIIDAYKKQHGPIKWNFHIPNPALDQLVKEFYYSNFWLPIKADQIKNEDIAANLFDMHINSGSAIKIMQRALNKLGYKLDVDNAAGNDTIKAINSANPSALNKLYLEGRTSHYQALVKADPSQSKFYAGWIDRLMDFTSVTGGTSAIIIFGIAGAIYYFFFKRD